MLICRWLTLIALLIFGSLGVMVPSASAETKELNFTLPSQGGQTLESLVKQAEVVAINSIQEGFAENSQVTEVYIKILGEVNGQILPLLTSRVTRADWQRDPTIHRWTQYFANAGLLLGLYTPQVAASPPLPEFAPAPARSRLEDTPGFRDD